MKAHMSDGHLYAGDKIRKLQAKRYFLIDQPGTGEEVFFTLYDAECYCQKHGYNPDECIKSGDPEIWNRAINLARIKSKILKEQADLLYALVLKNYSETKEFAEVRDRREAECKRNFDREWDRTLVSKSIDKGTGLYEAYKVVNDRAWYYEQIVLMSRKP